MKSIKHTHESGMIGGQTIAIIGLGVLVLILGSTAIWALINYQDQKSNVDDRVAVAVADGQKKQADSDETKYAEREKDPLQAFLGPDDYGRLTFNYPKTWSAYVDKDGSSGGDFNAYLNPVVVPPIGNSEQQQFALRIVIEQKDYDQVVQSFDGLVKKGDLKSSSTSSQGNQGTRLDGKFSTNIRGSAVIFKSRDKTIIIRTDADTFKPDFENLIKTIQYNA